MGEKSLYQQALETMERAAEAKGAERHRLTEEALRFYRLARQAGLMADQVTPLASGSQE